MDTPVLGPLGERFWRLDNALGFPGYALPDWMTPPVIEPRLRSQFERSHERLAQMTS